MKYFFDIQLKDYYSSELNRFHFHEAYEIAIVLEGSGEMGIGSRTYTMKKGAVMLLDNTVLHRSKVESGAVYRRYVIKFPPEYGMALSTPQTDLLKMFSQNTPCIILDKKSLEEAEKICARAAAKGEGYGDDLMCQSAFTELLIMLNKVYPTAEKAGHYHSKSIDKITPIMEYICANAEKNISLDEIAGQFSASKQNLCYIFKRTTGMCAGQYLTAQRLIHACSLLRRGESVLAAGERSGFRNNSHFIRTFKKALGVSPGKYSAGYKETFFI